MKYVVVAGIVLLVMATIPFLLRTMEHQKAIAILKSLLDRHPLDAEEKEADSTAIGVLSWSSLAKSKIRAQKAKRDKSTEW